MKATKILIS